MAYVAVQQLMEFAVATAPKKKITPEAKAAPIIDAAPLVEEAPRADEASPEAPIVATPAGDPIAEVAPMPTSDIVSEPVGIAAPPPAAQLLEGPYKMTDMIENGKKFAEDAKAKMETLVADFNEKAKGAMEKSGKAFEEFGDIAKGNVEAFIESSKIAAKGAETFGQGAAEYSRAQFEKTSATLKSFASVKSPTEFFQLQSQLLTGLFDSMAAETAKSSEAMLKLAGEVAQPLSSRASIVTERVKALAA